MSRFVAGAAIAVGVLGFAPLSYAASVTYVQTSDHCTGDCGINPAQTVTISDVSAGVIDIQVSLAPGWSFINTGAGQATFAFSSSLSNLTLSVQSDTTHFATWSTIGPVGSLKMDGLTFNTSAYGLNTTDQPNGESTGNNFLDFHVSASGLTEASFVAALQIATNASGGSTGDNALFAADVLSPKTGCGGPGTTCTGIIDFSVASAVPGPIAGAGLPGLIAACGGLLGLARRRRRKVA